MDATLGLAEAPRLLPVGGGPHDAREALDRVEPEVGVVDGGAEPEEALDATHLVGGVGDEALAVHEVDLRQSEATQPARDVSDVESDADRAPRRVDAARSTGLVRRPAFYTTSSATSTTHHTAVVSVLQANLPK